MLTAFLEGTGDPELGLLQVMIAEHGPGGLITILVAVFVWKVAIPGLQAAGKMARDLFNQHLEQGAKTLERLASLETAVKAGDAHNAAKLDSVQRGLENSLGAAISHMHTHDREIESLKLASDGHEHRIRGVELQLSRGDAGAYRRPKTLPPPSAGD
jgi:hypothetical protein